MRSFSSGIGHRKVGCVAAEIPDAELFSTMTLAPGSGVGVPPAVVVTAFVREPTDSVIGDDKARLGAARTFVISS